ncbi:ABC transporter ATP-binding protein [Phytoactinopolyspora mesophila]|uniref:ABC transporter ATP-binding protein n=1 Tax=Phytoactinopolyspora mesophila TaxID=2650750 RepID=UPI001C9E8052
MSKTYQAKKGTPVQALTDISLDIAEGEVVTLVGPSGCGKSTLLRLLGGLHMPTEGEMLLAGQRHTGPSHRIGIVYQQPLLLPWKNVIENVLVPIRVRRAKLAPYRERARELLTVLGLDSFAQSYPHQLSGGMQQRVGIARALIQDPEILLMDEPFGALDAMTRDALTVELLRIHEEFRTTIAFVTHSIAESVLLADRVVVMTPRPGRVAQVLPVDLPRPRTLEDVNSERFGQYASGVRTILDEHLGKHTKAVA